VGRFVDLDPSRPGGLPPTLQVRVGDLLRFRASGGRVVRGEGCVRLLGSFTPAVLSTADTVLSPEGGPTMVVLWAVEPGSAAVEVVTGDPWRTVTTSRVEVLVAAG
jgi:hypothetical protein